MRIYDLMNMDDLSKEIIDGYVRWQNNPDFPEMRIYNYTEKAQFDNHWTDVTMQCRGLIVSGEYVIARPFPKFFNYEQRKEHFDTRLFDSVGVSDKMDGSLGIVYRAPEGKPRVATRGSFTSDQASHATELLHKKIKSLDFCAWDMRWTPLFEIVYPANRIVCDYGELDDLVLLGAVNVETGEVRGPYATSHFIVDYNGPIAEEFHKVNLAEALAMEPREGAEGVVVRFLSDNEMCKIKQEDYVILHRLVTGLSEKSVWEALGEGKNVEQICEPLPDEFHSWVAEVADKLRRQFELRLHQINGLFLDILFDLEIRLDEDWTRKDFALAAKDSVHRGFLFALLDGNNIEPKVWQSLKPVGDTRIFNGQSEDVA